MERVDIQPNLNRYKTSAGHIDPDAAQALHGNNVINIPQMRHKPTREETFQYADTAGFTSGYPWVTIGMACVIVILVLAVAYLGYKLNELNNNKKQYMMRRMQPEYMYPRPMPAPYVNMPNQPPMPASAPIQEPILLPPVPPASKIQEEKPATKNELEAVKQRLENTPKQTATEVSNVTQETELDTDLHEAMLQRLKAEKEADTSSD